MLFFLAVRFIHGKLARVHHHPFPLGRVVLPPREAFLREALNSHRAVYSAYPTHTVRYNARLQILGGMLSATSA